MTKGTKMDTQPLPPPVEDRSSPRRPSHPRLAVDLDGVLTEYPSPLATAANFRFGLDLPPHTFVDSIGLDVPLAVREWVYSAGGPACDLQPAESATGLLGSLLDLFGPEHVRIITARPPAAQTMTREWLRRHHFPACQVAFADDKVVVARACGTTHAIEDSSRHAITYAAGGITCFLLAGQADPVTIEPSCAERVVAVRDLTEAVARLRLDCAAYQAHPTAAPLS